ncbi:hypothetical protein VTI74DRAFT_2174 [Chaetomium olivicolor]
MTFSKSIKALLDTYANCISLLKGFKHGREEYGTADTRDQHSHLRRSLKTDRSLIEQAYSLKVSESGDRFRKGDDRAITALDLVLKGLRKAITNLLRLSSKKDGLDLDYESLMSLSNASRVSAIKAINGLSRRLGGPSRSSVASASSGKTPPNRSSHHQRKPSSKTRNPPPKPSKETGRQPSPSNKPPVAAKKVKTAGKRYREGSSPPPFKSPGRHAPVRISRTMSANPKPPEAAAPRRISILSFSSDSTKLGEIPQRKWQSVMRYTETDPDGDEYHVTPTFPLKPYTVEVRERRFWGLFGSRRRDS